MAESGKATRRTALVGVAGMALGSCASLRDTGHGVIKFSRIPQADPGGRDKHDIVEGSVTGALPGERIVLYARSGNWWVQPVVGQPFTKISKGSTWTNATHLGSEYAALLVKPEFQPPASLGQLPERGGLIAAVASVKGASSPPSPSIHFSGYEWRVRDAPSSRGGRRNIYQASNVWTDPSGAMRLRIAKSAKEWTCAEVSLTRSLGYGTYSFTVRDTSALEPAAVFSMFTWDYARQEQNFGEIDIEISQWGDPTNKNAQFTIQPFYVPVNVARFSAPAGTLVYSFRWEPGRMSFQASRPSAGSGTPLTVADHVFMSGIPSPGIESVRMNLYTYAHSRVPFGNGAEVVIEKFEYLP